MLTAKQRSKVLDLYRKTLLETGQPPVSIYRFCADHGFKEEAFYATFASFGKVEGELWASLVTDAVNQLTGEKDFAEQGARPRLLGFYFTFLEIARANRSFLLLRFPGLPKALACSRLRGMEEKFAEFSRETARIGEKTGEIAGRGKVTSWFPRITWGQFIFLLDFYLKDESEAFERTDALVEKSTRLLFDAAGEQVIDSAFDLFRFLAGRSHG